MANPVTLNHFHLFQSLPPELRLKALEFACAGDLATTAKCANICRQWKDEIMSYDPIWKHHYERILDATAYPISVAQEMKNTTNLSMARRVRVLLTKKAWRTEWATKLTQDLTELGERRNLNLIERLNALLGSEGSFEERLFSRMDTSPARLILFLLQEAMNVSGDRDLLFQHLFRLMLFIPTWQGKAHDDRELLDQVFDIFPNEHLQPVYHKGVVYLSLLIAFLLSRGYSLDTEEEDALDKESFFSSMEELARPQQGSILSTFPGLLLLKEFRVSHLIKAELFEKNSKEHIDFTKSLVYDYLEFKRTQDIEEFITSEEYLLLPVELHDFIIERGDVGRRILQLLQESLNCIDDPATCPSVNALAVCDFKGAKELYDKSMLMNTAKLQVVKLINNRVQALSKVAGTKRKLENEENSTSAKDQRQL